MPAQTDSPSAEKSVLYVTKTSILGEGGGGEKRAKEVTSRLADRGHAVTVACGRTDQGLSKWTTHQGCLIRHIKCAPEYVLQFPRIGFYLPRYLFAFTSLPVLCYLLFAEDYDVVVENMTPYPTLTVVLAKLFGVPIVAVQHEFHGNNATEMYDPVTGRIQLLVQNLLRLFDYDRVIVPTRYVRAQLSAYGVPWGRIEVVPNGINYERFARDTNDRDRKRLVTVSRLGTRKGVDDVIRAFATVREVHPDATLDIVGSGPERDSLEELARRLDVDEGITFHGYVSHERKVELLNRADLFLFASRQEGFGLVLLEAMAAGLPVVARELPVYHDFFKDGANGYLVEDDRAETALGDRTVELLEYQSRTRQIRKHNERTAEQYGWDNTAEMTEKVLMNI